MVLAGGPLTPVVPAADDDLPLVKIAILACTTDRVWGTSKRLPVLAKGGVSVSDSLRIFLTESASADSDRTFGKWAWVRR